MNIYEQQAENRKNTSILLVIFVCFFLIIGLGFDFFLLAWKPPTVQLKSVYDPHTATYSAKPVRNFFIPFGTLTSLIVGFIGAFSGYRNGKRLVLASTDARMANPNKPNEKVFINIVAEIATAAGLPRPMAYIVPDPDPNAFSTGTDPDDSVIAVTRGLLDVMTREELAAVVAHEMSHIRNYDVRLMTVLTALVGSVNLISGLIIGSRNRDEFGARRNSALMRYSAFKLSGCIIADGASVKGTFSNGKAGIPPHVMIILFLIWLLLIVLSPMLSSILKMAVSRQREYLADASAAELTRNPKGLISALEKIYAATGPTTSIGKGIAHLCIMDPRGSYMEERSGLAADALATHPPMQKRILALKAMAYSR
ncbi:MAG: M48 family metalloprotease [Elusimicrobiales bacterium]|nr:M48 family metalloprotease [Elusimicrobiales bacterium]